MSRKHMDGRCDEVIKRALAEDQADVMHVALSHGYAEEHQIVARATRWGATRILGYILDRQPELLEMPGDEGHTPLAIAGTSMRVDYKQSIHVSQVDIHACMLFSRLVVDPASE
jgi:hypothetical protein